MICVILLISDLIIYYSVKILIFINLTLFTDKNKKLQKFYK